MNDPIQTENSDIYAIHHPNVVPAGRGAGWLADGFGYFRKAPLQWVVVCIVGFVIVVGINLIPFVAIFSSLLAPVWSAGLMAGCKDLHEGKDLQVRHLFAGFGNRVGSLIISGLLVVAISLVLVMLVFGSVFFQLFSGDASQISNPENFAGFGLRMLVMFVLMIPVYAASWFSPALIMLGDIGVIDAFKLSFNAGLRNILPLLVYMIMAIVLTIVAAIPLGLGFLVAVPMFIASIFISFREIFVE
ncbi:MAG: BPSS1780 family membrane protein [Pseudomonadota bacterium]